MEKRRRHESVFVLISLILLLVFGLGLGGMTYIDSNARQKEMAERMEKADSKCQKLLREYEKDERNIEEDMFYFSREMENIYDTLRGENIGFYGTLEDENGKNIYENGDLVFYHI